MVETLQERMTWWDPDTQAQGLGRTQTLARDVPGLQGREEPGFPSEEGKSGEETRLCFGSPVCQLPEAGGKTHQSTSWAPMRSCTW